MIISQNGEVSKIWLQEPRASGAFLLPWQ
jgi:hypothetical protein